MSYIPHTRTFYFRTLVGRPHLFVDVNYLDFPIRTAFCDKYKFDPSTVRIVHYGENITEETFESYGNRFTDGHEAIRDQTFFVIFKNSIDGVFFNQVHVFDINQPNQGVQFLRSS